MTHHHHDHQEHESCGCSCHSGTCPACHGEVCGAGNHHDHHDHHHHDDFAGELLDLADEAWMELLFEKIKKQIESSDGKQLDELAKIVCDSNRDRWKHKLAKQRISGEYREKVAKYFGRE